MNEKPIAAGKSSYDLIDAGRLFAELDLKEDTIFCDVACGRGAYSLAASGYIGKAGRIYAFDLWKEGIDSLKDDVDSKHIDTIQPRVVDISKRLPLEEHSIDVCLMATVLHDLIQDKTDRGTLKEVQRVLKPGGTLAVVEFKKIEGPPGPPAKIRIAAEETEEHLRPFCFRLVKVIDIGPYNYLAVFTSQNQISKCGSDT